MADDIVKISRARQLLKTGEARRIREAANVSMRAAADHLGVTVPVLSRWETGERRPKTKNAIALYELLGGIKNGIFPLERPKTRWMTPEDLYFAQKSRVTATGLFRQPPEHLEQLLRLAVLTADFLRDGEA